MAKLKALFPTPATLAAAVSTRRTQEAQVMPSMATVIGSWRWMRLSACYLAPLCLADMQWPVDQIVLEILDIDLFFADRAAAGRDAGLVNRFRIA